MDMNDFNFDLPDELIAQEPASPRNHAKLLVYKRDTKEIIDDYFYNLASYLNPNTTLVLNKAKVDKCRMVFDKVEVFLLETHNDTMATAMVRPGKRFKLGATVQLTDSIEATVTAINDRGHRTLTFNTPLHDSAYEKYKLTPLPPYIAQNEELADEYQTVYAKDQGSKAAPTAGLHFTDEQLADIASKWPIAQLTLDVGLGTFAPIGKEEIQNKRLHEETYSISAGAAKALNEASHITAVGTTSARALESAKRLNDSFAETDHAATDIFIQPGDSLQAVDSIITNFHLPSTSLLMLISAFTGTEELMRIYRHAIDQKYRFYSFGDAMLVV